MNALVQAQITKPDAADSILQAAHVACSRRAHQVTAAALYILQHLIKLARTLYIFLVLSAAVC